MIRFILADLRRLWLGSLVVVLLVALATALGISVTLQERALRLGSAHAADKFDLVIGAPGSETQLVLSTVFLQPAPLTLLPGEVLERLAADPRVAWVAPVGFGDSFAGHPIVGTTRQIIESTSPGFADGRMFATEGEAVAGAAAGVNVGDEIEPMHGNVEAEGLAHKEVAYRVSGVLKPTGTSWDRAILVPIQAVWHVHGMEAGHDHDHEETGGAEDGEAHEHGTIDADAPVEEDWHSGAPGVPALLVKPKSIADAYRLRQEYRSDGTIAVFPAEILTQLYATLGDAKSVLVAIAGGAQVLVAAALLLVTIIHVGQRRRQIGALRAFGAPRHAVLMIVWLELALLLALGIGAGLAIGYGAALFLAARFTAETGIVLPVGFSGEDLPLILALFAFALILSAVPAIFAYRQSPASALRS